MDEKNNVIASMEVYGAEGMFGDQYSEQVNTSSQSLEQNFGTAMSEDES